MKRIVPLLFLLALGIGCGRPEVEPTVVRLVDLAGQSESSWPALSRQLPKEIEGLRTFGRLRKKKVGRVAMFPEAGGDSRLSLLAPTGTTHRFDVELPAHAVLKVGLGYLPRADDSGSRIAYTISMGRGGGEEPQVVLDESLATSAAAGWLEREVDLSSWSGERVELILETQSDGDESLVWAAWSSPEIVEAGPKQGGTDVILISLDTLRADRLGCYGYAVDTSPNIDRFAARGIRFEQAVSQSPWTYPSHLSLFNGLYFSARDSKKAPRLAEVLHASGYRTEALTGGGQMDFRMGFGRGFDGYRIFDWIREPAWLTEWLDRSDGRRRFLFLHTYEIHDPYGHHTFTGGLDGGRVEGDFEKMQYQGLGGKLTEAEQKYVSALYDGGIAYADAQLGGLFEVLERSGALERSVIIVTSDHGEQFWEHGSWRHGMNLYEHQLRVPLIMHLPEGMRRELGDGPGLAGGVIDQQVRLVDLLPTILDLLGLDAELEINGRSLRPLLEGGALPPVDAFAEKLNVNNKESKALRTGRYKFIHTFPNPLGIERGLVESWELYDLRSDPREQDNLVERYPEEAAELSARLEGLVGLLAAEDEPEESKEELDPDLEARLRALGYLD